MPHRNYGRQLKYNSNSVHVDLKFCLRGIQLRGSANPKMPVTPGKNDRCDQEVDCNVECIYAWYGSLRVRCCTRILGIIVLSERRVRKFRETNRSQSAPSPFAPPCFRDVYHEVCCVMFLLQMSMIMQEKSGYGTEYFWLGTGMHPQIDEVNTHQSDWSSWGALCGSTSPSGWWRLLFLFLMP